MDERSPEPLVTQPEQASVVPVLRARGARMSVLIGPDDGASHFVMRRFHIDPGGRIPSHTHESIEHEQVVVKGEMVIGLNDEEHTVRAGDAIFIPAGTAHWYENRGTKEVEFLCVVPYTSEYSTNWLEEPPEGAAKE
jgi:quercetin dioxygenase-like cupin family protein